MAKETIPKHATLSRKGNDGEKIPAPISRQFAKRGRGGPGAKSPRNVTRFPPGTSLQGFSGQSPAARSGRSGVSIHGTGLGPSSYTPSGAPSGWGLSLGGILPGPHHLTQRLLFQALDFLEPFPPPGVDV